MKGSYYTDMELKQLNIIQSVIDKKRTGKEAASARDFDSFKTTKSYKPLKNGYFFVNLLFFILRTLSYFDIMYIQGSDKHAYKKN